MKDGCLGSADRVGARVGLALGGGAELGLAHVGVLHVLERHGIVPYYLGGTSSGALVASFYAAGASVAKMKLMGKRLSWRMFQRMTIPILALGTNAPFGTFLRLMLPVREFDALQRPLRLVTTDLGTAEMVVFEGGPAFEPRGLIEDRDVVFARGDLVKAIRASCARPVITQPVEIDGRLLVDGSLACNVPSALVRDMGAAVVIAVDVQTRRWRHGRPKNILAYAAQAQEIFLHWTLKRRHLAADVVIRPDFSELKAPDFSAATEIIESGEAAAEAAVPAIRAAMERASENARG